MLLLFDIRNDSISIALSDVKEISELSPQTAALRRGSFSCERCRTIDDCVLFFFSLSSFFHIELSEITAAAICSVVPALSANLTQALQTVCGISPFIVRPGIKSLLKIKIDNPAELGSDILVNAVAAATLATLPAIVMDIGTATTITAVTANAEITGAVICPGPTVCARALADASPQILFRDLSNAPSPQKLPFVGKNTNDSVHIGIMRGCAHLLHGFYTELSSTVFNGQTPETFVCGSFSEQILPYLEFPCHCSPLLTFQGLLQLYKINHSK